MDVKIWQRLCGIIEDYAGPITYEEKIGITTEFRDKVERTYDGKIKNVYDISGAHVSKRYEVEFFLFRTNPEEEFDIELYFKPHYESGLKVEEPTWVELYPNTSIEPYEGL